MNLTDKYLLKILPHLLNVDRAKISKISCACPYCSSRFTGSKRTKRCSAFIKTKMNGSWFFNCFRCGKSGDFSSYLEECHPDLFRAYHLERDQGGSTGKGFNLRKFGPGEFQSGFERKVL